MADTSSLSSVEERVTSLGRTVLDPVRLVAEFGGRDDGFVLDRCLHEVFAAQARRTPDAAAVIHAGRELSFADLDAVATRLARHLVSLGVGPGTRVAIYMERSADVIVAMLAIWKAGGAYVPMDPGYPQERIAYLLEDAAPKVVLCQQPLRAGLPALPAAIVAIDGEWDRDSAAALPTVSPRDIAYVIYTSGSTGQPKGVTVTHRNVLYFWNAAEQAIHRHHPEVHRVGVNAPIAFDMSVKQLVQLLSGRTLIFIPQDIRLEAAALLDFVSEQQIDVLDCTPSQLAGLLAAGLLERPGRALTTVLVGGEPITTCMWRTLAQSERVRFYNMYGPTECTVDATTTPITGELPHIGKPLANARIYILDPQGEPVPVGETGEIHIGGAGVAAGYLGRPSLTQQRFVTDPFSTADGARMYRTGDVGRWRPDGSIEFVGRNDNQVKVRGFRIELGELEAQLRLHEKVKDAVVVACEVAEGDKRLAAYVTARAQAPTSEELREHLKTLVPEPIVPSAFTVLPALPLNSNGKVDRSRLPAPQWRSQATDGAYEAPQTPIEETLAALWQAVLRGGPVGRHDSFWDMGGDSILAIQVAGLARRAGIALTVQQIYLHKTVAAVARLVSPTKAPGESSSAPQATSGDLPLMPLQRYFLACTGENAFYKDVLLMRLDCHMDLPADVLRKAMHHVVEHHDGLRIRIASTERGLGLRCAPSTAVNDAEIFQHLDLSKLPPAARERALDEVANRVRRVDDVTAVPMIRLVKAELGGDHSQLILAAHRAIWDPITAGIFFEDLLSACTQLRRQRTVRLPPKTTALHEWAKYLSTEGITWALKDERYWREQLTEEATRLPLDGDREGPYTFYHVPMHLSVEETTRLRQLTQQATAKTEEVLVAALARAISAWTGSPRVAVGLMNNGRDPLFSGIDVCRTVGWLATEYPVVLQPSAGVSAADAVRSVQQRIRAVPGQGLGYLILRCMGDRDLLAPCPKPGIVFNYVGAMNREENSPLRVIRGDWRSDEELRAREHSRVHINSSINENALEVVFTSNETFLKRQTVEQLAAAMAENLRAMLTG